MADDEETEDEEETEREGLSGDLLRHFRESYEKNREAMERLADL